MNYLYKQIKEKMDSAEHILLLTDERIDGDTIGSTLGMFHILQEMGKRATVFSPKELHGSLTFLPGTDEIGRDVGIFEDDSIDLVMIFDCSDGQYIEEKAYLPKMKKRAPLVVFDHHATNPNYGTINLIEENAASTADVVWRFVKAVGLPMNKDAAQCILTGICTDTVVFSTANTNKACLDAAVELARYGAKLQEIVRHTMMNRSVEALKLWGLAFERLHHNDEFGATTTAITRADMNAIGAGDEDFEGLSGFLYAMLEDSDTVLVLRETDDGGVKGSLRSKTRDVAALAAERYGGGGHAAAAGFKVEGATLEEKDGKWFVKKTQ